MSVSSDNVERAGAWRRACRSSGARRRRRVSGIEVAAMRTATITATGNCWIFRRIRRFTGGATACQTGQTHGDEKSLLLPVHWPLRRSTLPALVCNDYAGEACDGGSGERNAAGAGRAVCRPAGGANLPQKRRTASIGCCRAKDWRNWMVTPDLRDVKTGDIALARQRLFVGRAASATLHGMASDQGRTSNAGAALAERANPFPKLAFTTFRMTTPVTFAATVERRPVTVWQ